MVKQLRGVNLLFVFLPISVALRVIPGVPAIWIFLAAALTIVPLASVLTKATEEIAKHLGPSWGGLLNATFGNATELIIGLIALHSGLIGLVQASIAGSIISNICLVLGASIFAGGLKHKIQSFNVNLAGTHSINLLLASLSLSLPTIFALSYRRQNDAHDPVIFNLSVCVAVVLLISYIASLWFSLHTHEAFLSDPSPDEDDPVEWNMSVALSVLMFVSVLIAAESELLVDNVAQTASALGINQVFIGTIIIAVIGNAAEHASAVAMAMKDKMDISLNIAIGSSTQVAMFVAPLLVFGGVLMGHPMTFLFSVPQLTAIGFSVIIAAFIARDGKCHWLEGVQLLAAYAIIAFAFFYLPR